MTSLPKSLSSAALNRSRFTVVAAIAIVIAGLLALFGFPATEEPTIPFRTAVVQALLPGASTQRMERFVAQPLEEHIRQLGEIKSIDTVVRPGGVVLIINLRDTTKSADIQSVWQRVRSRIDEVRPDLPNGIIGPGLDDDYGRVSVLTLALTGKGYTAGQLQDAARQMRLRLQPVPGVDQVTLYGVQDERIYVSLSPAKLAAKGLTEAEISRTLAARNAIAPSGEVDAPHTLAIETSGPLNNAASLASVQIPLSTGGTVALGAIADIAQKPADPPQSAAIYNGQPAVILGVSMHKGLNVNDFISRLDKGLKSARADLPAGMSLTQVTNQGDVVTHDLLKVGQVFIETIMIVMGVVIAFLGWRAGLVTGLIVPLTVLGTLIFMRVAGIELHTISIAAIIISLGLFVDNAIVIIEDVQRRVAHGEGRLQAAEAAGRTMFVPLLVSSLAIIFAFAPLVMGESSPAEYMRSLAIVLTATLLISLFLAVTVIVVAARNLSGDAHHEPETGLIIAIRRWYVGRIAFILRRPAWVVGAMVVLLTTAICAASLLPVELLAPSARKQLQMPIDLAAGTSSRDTLATAKIVSQRLSDPKLYPELTGNTIYVGDGGPRFILGLNPPVAASHKAYAIVNLAHNADLDATAEHLRRDLSGAFPQARFDPKPFSLGSSEAGAGVFRLIGPDRAVLHAAAAKLEAALSKIDGMSVKDDAEGRILRIKVDVDQVRAAAAGVSSADIAAALDAAYSGTVATSLREGDIEVPVVVRDDDAERADVGSLMAVPVSGARGPVTGGIVTVGSVARVEIGDQPSVLNRRNELPVITVTARKPGMTGQAIADAVAPAIASLGLPDGYKLELGGEIEESAEVNKGLVTYFPLAILAMGGLFLWQFGSVRKTAIIMASMPFVLIGGTLGLYVTHQPLSFPATLGFLALAGIIVNNAVLLLERTAEELATGKSQSEAIAAAAEVRLRPILMTKLTCVLGLVPLFVFGGDLWRPLAAAMMGGLLLGTLITLVLIPALYALFFKAKLKPQTEIRKGLI